ncbi:MAG: hypothetical protein JNL50_13295 [Phycisphaerae bacterium]|nr:hypothetical protein [Phycisphaerae bacterium]
MNLTNPMLRLVCAMVLVFASGCRGVPPSTISDWTFAPMVKQFEPASVVRLDGKHAPTFLQGVADYYHNILTNAPGTHAIILTFDNTTGHDEAVKAEVFSLDGRLLLTVPGARARFVGTGFFVVGKGTDAVLWSLGPECATRVISLREAFPQAKFVDEVVAVSCHGDIAAHVDPSTLVIRTRDGELHPVPGVGTPMSAHMAWSGDGTFLVVTNVRDETFVVARDGTILAKWRRYVIAWGDSVIGPRSFVLSESERFFVAEVTPDYSWTKRSSLAWDASCCVMASPDGSVVLLNDIAWGYKLCKRTSGGGYQRVDVPSGWFVGFIPTEVAPEGAK